MRAALAFGLGCAAGAPGRDIPVYREYTQPISFYGEPGEISEFDAASPDQAALQSVRETQAREGLMGKETLLDLTPESGASVFASPAPLPGKMTPATGGGEDSRRGSGRNWLAKSLALPSLGQTPTNAAASAMSAGAQESSWGWLAGEVANLPDELRPEEEYNPMAAQEASLADGSHPFSSGRDAAQAEKKKAEQEPSTAAAFPERKDDGQKPSDRAAERSEDSVRDLEGGDRVGSTTMQSYRTVPAMAEMSRTRQMIAEMSAGARPDFSSLRAEAVGGRAGSGLGAERVPSVRSGLDFSSSPGGTTAWGALGNPPAAGSGSMGAPSSAGSSWQGGWSAQNAGAGERIPSRFDSLSDPVPAAVAPAATPGTSRPGISSGGYKPAWF